MWKHQRATWLTATSVLLAVAPKCPICFLAYFGVFGVAASAAAEYRQWLPVITTGWLVFTVAMLVFKREGQRQYGPALLGLLATFMVLVGKFELSDQRVVYGGIGALVLASGWRAWSVAQYKNCHTCTTTKTADLQR